MNRVLASCVAAVVVSGGAGIAFRSVAAAEDCYGLHALRVCATPNPAGYPSVDPTGNSIDECVHVGSPPCTPVSVPYPDASPGTGYPVDGNCYMGYQTCRDAIGPE